jgi:hypothetical protein
MDYGPQSFGLAEGACFKDGTEEKEEAEGRRRCRYSRNRCHTIKNGSRAQKEVIRSIGTSCAPRVNAESCDATHDSVVNTVRFARHLFIRRHLFKSHAISIISGC